MSPPDPLDRLDELIGGERLVMLTCWTAGGLLHSKPMTVLQHDAGGSFWFYVRSSPAQPGDELQYRHVNLAFSHPDQGRHVSLAMAASIAAGKPIGLGEHGAIDLGASARP